MMSRNQTGIDDAARCVQPPFTWLAVTTALIVVLHSFRLFRAGRVEWLMLAGLLVLGLLAGWESNTLQEAGGVVRAQAGRLYDGGKQKVNDQAHKFKHRNDAMYDDAQGWDNPVGTATSSF